MLHESMNCDLFVELSDEQQQLVAGGTGETGGTGGMGMGIGSLKDKLSTYYNTNGLGLGLNVAQASTPQGSFNQQNFTTEVLNINTAAFKDLFAELTPN
jgi:DNA uptake protein ComE-like DNA-binding protein